VVRALAIGLGAIRSMSRGLLRSEEAQDTFEYVIIIGVVVVAVIAAVITPIGNNLITFVTGATSSAVSNLYT
jgi:hypothetical protein